MEQNRCLIQNVQNACKDLDLVSGETLENADNIYNGTRKSCSRFEADYESSDTGIEQQCDNFCECERDSRNDFRKTAANPVSNGSPKRFHAKD